MIRAFVAIELPAEVRFSDLELQVLRAYAKQTGCRPPRGWAMPCGWWPGWAATWPAPRIRPPAIR